MSVEAERRGGLNNFEALSNHQLPEKVGASNPVAIFRTRLQKPKGGTRMKYERKVIKKEWVKPCITVYGDMTELTQQCSPPACKPKELGFGDDFSNNISSLG